MTNKNNITEYAFVYGTLKKGFPNNTFLQDEDTQFIGDATTKQNGFLMISLGPFPAVLEYNSNYKISGEIYKVTKKTLDNLDYLESNGSLYTRKKKEFILSSGKTIEAWIYLMPPQILSKLQTKRGGIHNVQTNNNILSWL